MVAIALAAGSLTDTRARPGTSARAATRSACPCPWRRRLSVFREHPFVSGHHAQAAARERDRLFLRQDQERRRQLRPALRSIGQRPHFTLARVRGRRISADLQQFAPAVTVGGEEINFETLPRLDVGCLDAPE